MFKSNKEKCCMKDYVIPPEPTTGFFCPVAIGDTVFHIGTLQNVQHIRQGKASYIAIDDGYKQKIMVNPSPSLGGRGFLKEWGVEAFATLEEAEKQLRNNAEKSLSLIGSQKGIR